MATGNGYKLDFQQADYLGQEIHNLFFYKQTAGSDGAAALGSEFDADVLNVLKDLQSDGLAYVALHIVNLDDPGDFADVDPVTTGGTVTGEDMPPFTATEFRYNRATRTVRNGWKRFGGVTQLMMANEALDTPYIAIAVNVAAALEANVTDLAGNVWKPQIARRSTTPGPVTYTLFDIAGVGYVRVTTQNTRKLGR